MFTGKFTPHGWMECAGQTLNIADHSALFSIIGNEFGGDGKETFSLPRILPHPIGYRYIIAIDGEYPQRS
jgi:microcystin-dependent protein